MIIPFILSCDGDNMEVQELGGDLSNMQYGPESNTDNGELKETINEVLIEEGHTELLEALDYVNDEIYTQLVELFADQMERHTVFAPNNDAFFKMYRCLGMKTNDISELEDPGFVRDILLYHVARGSLESDDIIPDENDNKVNTLFGQALTIKKDRTIQSIGSIALIGADDADKKAVNGVVHVINEVLLPVELSCQGS